MEFFYDGQIRKYLVQIMRLFSNFSYKPANGDPIQVPVMYGDATRQVASILRDNSENKVPSAPRIAIYITGLEMDRDRTSDSSFVSKKHVRERAYDAQGKEYLNFQGKNYTIERLMPTPYKLTVNVDIWSTNTNQKLQLLEQILMLFNPSLEIQTTDNYLDWTSLSVVNLDNVNFSNRSIPTGTETEIDIAQLTFSTPIYISPPAKVKRLGVITKIITSVFDGNGYVDFEQQLAGTNLFSIGGSTDPYVEELSPGASKVVDKGVFPNEGSGEISISSQVTRVRIPVVNNPIEYRILIMNNKAKILENGLVSGRLWTSYLEELPGEYQSGLSLIYLRKPDIDGFVGGRITVNPLDESELIINFDRDTLPSNDVVPGPARDTNQFSSIDYIIDPLRFDPNQAKTVGVRMLLLGAVGNSIRDRKILEYKSNLFNTNVLFKDIYLSNVIDGSSNAPIYEGSYGEKVYVTKPNGSRTLTLVNIIPESDNPQGNIVFQFNEELPKGTIIEYELFLNIDGADAWKNASGTDFSAGANDIVEWDGNAWHIVFDASQNLITQTQEIVDALYTTNLTTGIQYYWNGEQWLLSVEGEYAKGDWSIELDG